MERNLTIRVKIWLFFMMFVCIVFILMWILQVVFLERFYEAFKIADIAKSAKILTQSCRLDNFSDIAEDQAMRNEMCISIPNTDGEETYQHCVSAQKCLLHNDQDVYFFLMDLKRSDNGYICRSIYNEQLQTQTVVYGNWILDSETNETVGYLLLNSRLVPVQSTVSILQRQTMIITIAMAFFGCVLSFLAATHIGVPITRLTRSAKRLAHGDYETKFEGGGCAEVDELAEALTYAEHELSRTDEMQRDLIANVSHDMRTPLTMMKAYAEMIRDLSGNNPEKRAKHLQVIIEETDRLSLLVNDMLDLSKLESGTKKLEFTTFDISQRLKLQTAIRAFPNRWGIISISRRMLPVWSAAMPEQLNGLSATSSTTPSTTRPRKTSKSFCDKSTSRIVSGLKCEIQAMALRKIKSS